MTRVVLVASSPRLPLLFPPQTWRALDAARPVWLLDAGHPSQPALEVAEVPWEVLAPADTPARPAATCCWSARALI